MILPLISLRLSPATAYSQNYLSYRATFGPDGYIANNGNIFLGLPSNLDLIAGYSTYNIGGIVQIFLLSVGRSTPKLSLYLNGSLTPIVNSYRSKRLGMSGSFRLANIGSSYDPDYSPLRVYLTFGYDRSDYTDGAATIAQTTLNTVQLYPQDNNIIENDYTGGVKIKYYETTFSASLILSNYNATNFPSTPNLFVSNPPLYQQGYPDHIAYLKINHNLTRDISCYTSYSYIDYKFGQSGIANSYLIGAIYYWKRFEMLLEYNCYAPSEGDVGNYFSVGIGSTF